MAFACREAKGIACCRIETGLDPQKLRFHISEIAPGTRAHAPHVHEAVEAFYVLEGRGMVKVGGECIEVGPNEAVILDARTLHGLENTGTTPMRYMVIMAPA